MDSHTLRVLEFYKVRDILKQYAASEPGAERADALVPSDDPAWIKRSLKEVYDLAGFINAGNSVPLGGLKDVTAQLKKAAVEGAMLSPHELADVAGVARCSRLVKAQLSRARERFPAIHAHEARLGVFQGLEGAVENAIGADGEVLDSASFELRRIRRSLAALKARINKTLEHILQDPACAKAVQEQVITMRSDRYVLPLKPNFKMYIKGIVHDHSATRSTVYVEPEATVELNNRVARLKVDERAEVERVLRGLTAHVREAGPGLESSLDELGEIDLINAKAAYARAIDAAMPEVRERGAVDLGAARHPLLIEAIGQSAVPLDIRLGDGYSCMVITGPNTGGKTVVLKTVGLLALMAQAGMLIPASPDSALPVFTGVYSDIGDEQSVEQSLSTFSAHMGQIVRILGKAGPDTLVLLDELGAGTDPAEGSALGVAILDELNKKGAKVVVTSHHGALKLYAANTRGVTNASVEFDPETLMPTYRLLVGRPGMSNALVVAKRLGMPEQVVQAAAGFKGRQDLKMEALIEKLEREARAARQDRAEAASELENAKAERARLEAQLARAESERKEAVRKAREKAGGVLRSLRTKLRELEELEKKAPERPPVKAEVRKIGREVSGLEAQLRFTEAEKGPAEKADISKLSPGDNVRVYKYGKPGRVLDVKRERGQVVVQVGALKVTLGPDELEPVAAGAAGAKKAAVPAPVTLTRDADEEYLGPTGEINLVGKRVEEALALLDKYIDDCLLNGMGSVRVIHGRGTGALRSAVREMLEGHMGVESVSQADPEQGGDAVTVARLKG